MKSFVSLDIGRRARWMGAALALGVLLLGGCAAPTVTTRVTTFQQWPADAPGQYFRFSPSDYQRGDLEYQAYEDMVRAAIGPTGLVEAQGKQAARFSVSFDYDTTPTQRVEQRPYDPYFTGGAFGPPWWGGPWGPGWMGPGWYAPTWIEVQVPAVRNNLHLQIKDASRNDAEVYRASAYIVSSHENLVRAMPYLVRAIFDGFPGNNGSERRVEYPLEP